MRQRFYGLMVMVLVAVLAFRGCRESQPTLSSSKEIGGEVLLIDPLSPDWLDNLRQVSETFARVLSPCQTLLPKARIGVYALIPYWV